MKVIQSSVKSTFTIKKSKFLCFGYFVHTKDEIKEILADIKKEYADASHICYAYVLDDKTYYYTDGGEPSGSAGKPIYGAILSNQLNYTLLVVVRYFGGIKFGPGPLRATFKDVSMQTLANAYTKEAFIMDLVKVQIPYSQIKQVTTKFKDSIYTQEFTTEHCLMWIAGNKEKLTKQLALMKIKPIAIKENQVV